MIHVETQKLLLSPPAKEDFNFVSKLYSNTEMMKFLGGVLSPLLIEKLWENWLIQWKLNKFSVGILREKGSENKIGVAGVFPPGIPREKGVEIGFMITKDFQNKGFASEISKALIEISFTYKLTNRIIAYPHPENKPSIQLFEKLKFNCLGNKSFIIPEAPNFKEQILFELLKKDWTVFDRNWSVYQ